MINTVEEVKEQEKKVEEVEEEEKKTEDMLTEKQKAGFERLTGIIDKLKNQRYTPNSAATQQAEE